MDEKRFRCVSTGHELFAHHFSRLCDARGIAEFHGGDLRRDLGAKNESAAFKRAGLDKSTGKIGAENVKLICFFPGVPREDQQSFKVANRSLRMKRINQGIFARPQLAGVVRLDRAAK